MKIAQIVAPGASEYERKSQRVDFAALSEAGHHVAVYQSADVDGDLAHVYGKARRIKIPHVIDGALRRAAIDSAKAGAAADAAT